jgi:type II secretory pathway pseudopilin PulG
VVTQKMIQNTKYKIRNTKKGFTLIEALAFLFIFSIITLTFYQTWSLGTKQIINSKNRLGATALASQQMETIRGLPFDSIGTTTGIPSGSIVQSQSVSVNAATYTLHTLVQFVDDATDGTLALGTDVASNDYKKVTVTVSWGGGGASEQVTAVSLFSLDGVESVAAGTGILSVNVLNDAGVGVSGATVHVVNSSVAPAVDMTFVTDANGNGTFPGAKASVQGYEISVSKTGYYGNQTYPPYPTSTFNPTSIHTSVVAGSLTTATLVSDQKSTIAIRTKDPYGVDVPNLNFTIFGGLAIGTDPVDSSIKYDYTQSTSTDGSGEKDLDDRSSGVYTVSLDASETGYEFVRLSPEESVFGTINVLPNVTKQVDMILADKTFSSGLITVTNAADTTPVAGASVQMENTGLGYSETVVTDASGKAYFPSTNTPLVAGTYDVEITATGFTVETGNIVISGSALEKKSFSLTAS